MRRWNAFLSLKLLSVLFMTGYMLLGKYYVAKLFDRKISVYFMTFSLLMPIFSVQAGNVRMYAMALFFLTLAGLAAYDIFREATRRKWIVFCVASICTVYCHTFALIQTFFVLYAFSGGDPDLRQKGACKRIFYLRIHRLENPEMSLRDLGQNLSVPISRSGANHRMNRLLEYAEDLE